MKKKKISEKKNFGEKNFTSEVQKKIFWNFSRVCVCAHTTCACDVRARRARNVRVCCARALRACVVRARRAYASRVRVYARVARVCRVRVRVRVARACRACVLRARVARSRARVKRARTRSTMCVSTKISWSLDPLGGVSWKNPPGVGEYEYIYRSHIYTKRYLKKQYCVCVRARAREGILRISAFLRSI